MSKTHTDAPSIPTQPTPAGEAVLNDGLQELIDRFNELNKAVSKRRGCGDPSDEEVIQSETLEAVNRPEIARRQLAREKQIADRAAVAATLEELVDAPIGTVVTWDRASSSAVDAKVYHYVALKTAEPDSGKYEWMTTSNSGGGSGGRTFRSLVELMVTGAVSIAQNVRVVTESRVLVA